MRFAVSAFASIVLLASVGCSAASDGTEASESSITGDRVEGDSSARLLAAFESVGGIDHASGGARGIKATSVLCLARSNEALSENDPLYQVPVTECSYASEGYANRFSKKDDPLAATLVFDALADVIPPTAVGHESGDRSHIELSALLCEGHGLGGGFEPTTSPPFAATCDLLVRGGSAIHVEAAPARKILRALEHAKATDHSSGGSFGSDVQNLHCQRSGNGPLGSDHPMQGIAETKCDLVRNSRPLTVVDPKQEARALFVALEKAGVDATHAAGGQTGVMADFVKCYEGNGRIASCSVTE